MFSRSCDVGAEGGRKKKDVGIMAETYEFVYYLLRPLAAAQINEGEVHQALGRPGAIGGSNVQDWPSRPHTITSVPHTTTSVTHTITSSNVQARDEGGEHRDGH